jgi:hypothetical protein
MKVARFLHVQTTVWREWNWRRTCNVKISIAVLINLVDDLLILAQNGRKLFILCLAAYVSTVQCPEVVS